MKKLLKNAEEFYQPKVRPSGHDIGKNFAKDNGGAIPSNFIYNFLEIPNTESNSQYLRLCKRVGVKGHPARFPEELPSFFIKFLTEPGDCVVDIFAGSNTTGHAAETLLRKWISFEKEQEYIATSAFRFLTQESWINAADIYSKLSTEKPSGFIVPQTHQLFDFIN